MHLKIMSARWQPLSSSGLYVGFGAHPTNDILFKFEIESKFLVLWFKISSTDHNKIFHMSRQCYCRDMYKILLWSA